MYAKKDGPQKPSFFVFSFLFLSYLLTDSPFFIWKIYLIKAKKDLYLSINIKNTIEIFKLVTFLLHCTKKDPVGVDFFSLSTP